jgi:hypothetical protein
VHIELHALLAQLADVLHDKIDAVELAILEIIDIGPEYRQVCRYFVVEPSAFNAELIVIYRLGIEDPGCTAQDTRRIEAVTIEPTGFITG